MSLNETEKELLYNIGRLLEKIGEILFKDDYPDYLQGYYDRMHHYQLGRALVTLGNLLKTESEPEEKE